MTQTIDKDLIIFANRLANESRKILRNHFRKKIKIRYKSDQSPVTEADTKVEKKLRMLIQRKYPKHGIIGEEFENIQINAGIFKEFIFADTGFIFKAIQIDVNIFFYRFLQCFAMG